jgi:hypothetical protein
MRYCADHNDHTDFEVNQFSGKVGHSVSCPCAKRGSFRAQPVSELVEIGATIAGHDLTEPEQLILRQL